MGYINKDDIKDLMKLIKLVNLNNFKPKNKCFLNSHFGEASNIVGGADADLNIDDTLINVKTTKILKMKREYYDQLIVYSTLHRIVGINGMVETDVIKKIRIILFKICISSRL